MTADQPPHEEPRLLVGTPGEQILEPRLRVNDRLAQLFLAASGLGHPRWSVPVAPSRPRGVGTAEPNRADDEDQRHEQPEDPGPDFALQQGDSGEHEQHDDGDDQRHESAFADGQQAIFIHAGYRDRTHADEQERGDANGREDSVDREPALFSPVDVAKVQDQRELVEHESRSDAEYACWYRSPYQRMLRRGELSYAADAHEHDAEDHVVHVQRASPEVARPPSHLGADESDGQADAHEAAYKCYEKAEQGQAASIDDLQVEPA